MSLDDILQRIDPSQYIDEILGRSDLTWDIIQEYPVLQNNIKGLSKVAPLEYILDHSDEPWNFDVISDRKDLTIPFMRHFKDRLNWRHVSYPDFKEVVNNQDLPWNYVNCYQNITLDDILENPDLPYNYNTLVNYIGVDIVYTNPELPWDYRYLSDKVNFDFINQNPQIEWDHLILGRNPHLILDYVIENKNKNWNWFEVYSNPNITLDAILKHNLHTYNTFAFQIVYSEYCIENSLVSDWIDLSQSASLDLFDKYPEKPWVKEWFNYNPNITMSYILEHPELPWDYSLLPRFNGITLQDILDNWDLPWHIGNVVYFKY